MEPASKLAVFAAGIFFLNALVCGVWKYLQIRSSPDALAHPYVDIAHRASLLYSFAALLLSRFVELANYSARVELIATAGPLLFFALAIGTYIVHGALRDTGNQFERPHRLGAGTVSGGAVTAFMAALIIAEVAGFLVLFWGFVQSQIV
ncbi:MAG: hypothetical protein ACE5FC_07320 [Myxococcota bacterium]